MSNKLCMAGLAAGLVFGAPAFAAPAAPALVAPDVQATDDGQTDDLPLEVLVAPRAAEAAPVTVPYTFAPQVADSSSSVALDASPAAAPAPDAALAAAIITQAEAPLDKLAQAPVDPAAASIAPPQQLSATQILPENASERVEISEASPSSVLKTLDGKPWSPVRAPAASEPVAEQSLMAASASPELHVTDTAASALPRNGGPVFASTSIEPPPQNSPTATPEAPVKIVIEASVVSPAPPAALVAVPAAAPVAPPTLAVAKAPAKPMRTPLAPPSGLAEAPEAILQDAAFIANAADSAPVNWRTIISPSDKDRLAKLAATRKAAIKQAEAAIDAGNKSAIAAAPSTSGLIYATPIVASESDLGGEYRCRTTSLGGPAPKLVLYKYATCRIEQWPNGAIVIEKTSGTDRFIGRLWREPDSSFIYLGANFPEEGAAWAYNDNPAQNQVGRLYRIGANRLRLELPKPSASTGLNVVDFVRQK